MNNVSNLICLCMFYCWILFFKILLYFESHKRHVLKKTCKMRYFKLLFLIVINWLLLFFLQYLISFMFLWLFFFFFFLTGVLPALRTSPRFRHRTAAKCLMNCLHCFLLFATVDMTLKESCYHTSNCRKWQILFHRTFWVGTDLKYHLVLITCHRQTRFSLDKLPK